MTTTKNRTSRRWTKAEDATLTAGVLNGLTTAQIAQQLNRTTHSISCRKNGIGMTDVRIASPTGSDRNRNPKAKVMVNTTKVKAAKAVMPKPAKMKPASRVTATESVTAKTPDMISAIAETVSRMTKQYGVKATVIVFEN